MKPSLTALRNHMVTLVVACLSLCATLSFAAGPPMAILNARNPQVQAVMNIQDQYTPALMRLPGVVGTATGLDASGQLAIKVYVEWPEVFGIPPLLQGVPVEIEVTGLFVARLNSSTSDEWTRPVPIGVSTGHPNITAGTIGCRVVGAGGKVYALSNNHVYANSNEANKGDPVLQPGPYDGGTVSSHTIGTLEDFEPINFSGGNNTMDAAIALVTSDTVGVSTPSGIGYGIPSGTPTSAAVNMKVQKVGRTTGSTKGTVSAINATVNVCYAARGIFCTKLATFVNQIIITPGSFSAGGDSGSLIVTDDAARQPVGLLFAGSSTQTIASPIGPILERFGVSVDDGTGAGGGGSGPVNEPPVVSITSPENGSTFASGESIKFAGTATDNEQGDISASLSWTSSRDGQIGTGASVSKVLSPGTHTITASVTDDGGLSGSDSITVTVQSPTSNGDGIVLTARGYKVKGRQTVDLSWTGATSPVAIHWSEGTVVTGYNGTSYTHQLNRVGGGSYDYWVIDSEGVQSNTATVSF